MCCHLSVAILAADDSINFSAAVHKISYSTHLLVFTKRKLSRMSGIFLSLALIFAACTRCDGASESHELARSSMPNIHSSPAERKEWCTSMNEKYGIISGISFGTLPNTYHHGYLKMNCDEFFCKPHPLRGKGSYKCDPL